MPENQLHCSECGGRLVLDQAYGELVCSECGLVCEEGYLRDDPCYGDFTGGNHHRSNVTTGDRFPASRRMGSYMFGAGRDGKGRALSEEQKHHLRRLARLDRQSAFKTSTERNTNLALHQLENMCVALGLPGHVSSTAAFFYKFAVRQRLTVGRNVDDFLYSSIYCACLKSNYPMTLAELTGGLEAKGWGNISHKKTGKAVRLLKRSLHLKLSPPSPHMLISRFCSRLHLKRETELKTRDILSKIQDKGFLDGRPGGIAAAAIYIASHLCGEKVSQKHLAEVAGVTDMTVRHQYKIITRELNINFSPQ